MWCMNRCSTSLHRPGLTFTNTLQSSCIAVPMAKKPLLLHFTGHCLLFVSLLVPAIVQALGLWPLPLWP